MFFGVCRTNYAARQLLAGLGRSMLVPFFRSQLEVGTDESGGAGDEDGFHSILSIIDSMPCFFDIL